MTAADVSEVRSWMDESTSLFIGAIDRLSDASFNNPSELPGWTIAAVVAHVHFNAEAIRRLLHWAQTGIETPMYASGETRNAEIETGSVLPASDLRSLVRESADQLATDAEGLGVPAWATPVVTAMGRTVAASEALWMRTREVAVHAVDLGAGISFGDIPAGVTRRLSMEIVAKRAGNEGASIAAWLTGRGDAPGLEPWL
jgi:uncharacterized protein (TIGR03083 family)